MCEDLEQKYNELLTTYRKQVGERMAAEDYLQYNEVLFSAHSLGIEGNSYTVNDTQALKELGLGVVPQNKPLVETMEMLDHFHAYEQMLATQDEPLSEEYILNLHATLTKKHHCLPPSRSQSRRIHDNGHGGRRYIVRQLRTTDKESTRPS